MEKSLRLQTWVVVIGALLASISLQCLADDEGDLQDAFRVILSQTSEGNPESSPESNTEKPEHFAHLDERDALARAVQKALDSMNAISKNVDFKALRYRRFDGLGNNLKNIYWGASLHTERRQLNNSYDDSCAIPRYRSVEGGVLPSAREVSMKCFDPDEDTRIDPLLSQMFMQFGQFLDHDIILTELEIGSNCCADMQEDGTHPDMFDGNACFPIKVGKKDRFFKVDCLTARRSLGVKVNGVREQVNGVTSYIDASQVYGPAKKLSDEFRTFKEGKLMVTPENGLPQLGVFKCLKDVIAKCPHAGDPRVNVFPGLTIMHTAFHREHNRIAEKLAEVNPSWDDERLFQEARKIVIAINQQITYQEYLPKVIGPKMMKLFGFDKDFVYDDTLDASVDNVFGAAAFRFGHSQINGPLKITKSRAPGISEVFFRPEIMMESRDSVMKNIIIHQARLGAHATDHFFSPEVLDKLFLNVDAPGESFDLPALAVHRSRDHGLPSYLEYLDLAMKNLPQSIEPELLVDSLTLPKCLLDGTYESHSDIDLFVGAMYETPVEGGLVGPTFAYLLGDQFHRLRNGDRFFYETQEAEIGFTSEQLAEIKSKTSLSFVLCKNNAKLKYIQPKAMERRGGDNQKKKCDSYTDIDFSLWLESN